MNRQIDHSLIGLCQTLHVAIGGEIEFYFTNHFHARVYSRVSVSVRTILVLDSVAMDSSVFSTKVTEVVNISVPWFSEVHHH